MKHVPFNRLLIAVLLSVAAPAASHADDAVPSGYRTALLVGNAKYEGITLAGVGKSLDLVEKALKAQGYEVTRHEDLGEKDLKSAAEAFAKGVPTNGVALVYYIGLGANLERQGRLYNLLRPVDVKLANENDYRSRGLNLGEFVKSLQEQSGARVSLLFMDACWQSPIKPDTQTVRGGLMAFDPGVGAAVLFAAGSEKTLAAPSTDAASNLASALAKHLPQLDGSVKKACDAIAADLDQPWVGGATQAGIGPLPKAPVTKKLVEGKSSGDGYINSIGQTFRWCPSGSFTMGSEQTDTAATRDRGPAAVTLSKGFWMGEHEVTQREYNIVMRKTVPRGFTVHKNAPFWGVSETKQIADFCKKLTDLERKAGTLPDGWAYACPTEAQWEYACRAGSTSAYCFGDAADQLGAYGNFADKALWSTNPNYHWADRRADDGVAEALAPVGQYRPNAWGLRDMHGNVAELVADHLLPDRPGGTDPLVRLEKNGQTQVRGGAWCSQAVYCESSFRNSPPPGGKYNFIGFRIVLQKVK